MKQWKDEQSNTFWEPDSADEWLDTLWAIEAWNRRADDATD